MSVVSLEGSLALRSGRPSISYAIEQVRRPIIITGMERRMMRRRPMWSMMRRAMRVQRKFVRAMEREVRVGEEKPRREKMVAEKYIREF